MHSQKAFACGFVIGVGLRFMPYVLHRVSKCNLNLEPLSYIKYKHQGYLLFVYSRRYPKVLQVHSSPLSLPITQLGTLGHEETIRLQALLLPCLWLGSGAFIAISGQGEENFISISLLPSIPQNALIPSIGSIGPPLLHIFQFYRTFLRQNQYK